MCVGDEFRVDVVVRGGRHWVTVHGDLDVATAPELAEATDERIPDDDGLPVVLDLTDSDFMDSTGARAVVVLGRSAGSAHREFSIVSTPGSGARFTLDLLAVGEAFTLVDDVTAVDDAPGDHGGAVSA